MKTLYLFKTQSGSVYDRTAGRNVRLQFNSKYIIKPHGSFVIHESNGEMSVERLDKHNNTVYTYPMNTDGMYMVGDIHAKLTTKTNKYVQRLERYLTGVLGKARFKLTECEKDELFAPYKIVLHVWKDGTVRYSFNIKVDTSILDDHIEKEIHQTIDRLGSINLNAFLMKYMATSNNGMRFTVNEEFFDIVYALNMESYQSAKYTG